MRDQPLAHIDLSIGRLCSASHVVYERDCALTDASIKAEHDVEIFHVNLFFFVFMREIFHPCSDRLNIVQQRIYLYDQYLV